MAWMPQAQRRPVDRYQPGGYACTPMSAYRRTIFHTAVTNSQSLSWLFNVAGNAVSHFYVDEHGNIEQYIDTRYRSSANLEGNPDCITVETWDGYGDSWDGGDGVSGGPRWTKAQVEALADIARWAHKVHGVPLRRLKNSRYGTRGVGWHRQGIDGNFPSGLLRGRVSGGQHWSSSFGKTCPTGTRIRQTVNEVIKRARSGGKKRPFVNRSRVNRVLADPDGHIGKIARKQLDRLDEALERHGYSAEGYPKHPKSLRRAVRKFQRAQNWSGEDANGLLGPTTCRLLGLRSIKGKIKRRKPINMDHIQDAWNRKNGKVYNPWGKRSNRRWHKALKDAHLSGPKWNWTRAWFDKHLRASTYHANQQHNVTKWTGPGEDRPTWELAEKLGLNPHRSKKG